MKIFLIRPGRLYLQIKKTHTWIKPEGHDTGVKIFNTVSKQKESLIVRNKNFVSWYTCGPTVYDSAHLGHASCYVKLDIIQRILRKYCQLNIVTAMNITDIDDKILSRSMERKISVADLTKHYEKEFFFDLNRLGINKPNIVVRVTDNIDVIKSFIEKLVSNKKAYQAKDRSVYFDVEIFKSYGKLQNINLENITSDSLKKSSKDFALWKTAKETDISWNSSWGFGRPGWHIECSALASQIFGSNIDFHAGGIDLRFPHHENEEAQSCAFHKTEQWVNYWVHTGHLQLKSSKMSKSLKNTISINDMLKETSADDFRMACMMSHYRSGIEYTLEFMATARNYLKTYKNFVDTVHNYNSGLIKTNLDNSFLIEKLCELNSKIHNCLMDDFNTPAVIQNLNASISIVNSVLHSSTASDIGNNSQSSALLAFSNFVSGVLELFGFNIIAGHESSFTDNTEMLVNFRKQVRQLAIDNKSKELLTLCDFVRDDLKKIGIIVKDFKHHR